MIVFTTAQLETWIAAFFYPLTRILALLATAPPFNHPSMNMRARLVMGLAFTVVIAPLVTVPNIAPSSGIGLLIVAQQVIIGTAMGIVLRIIFSAVDMAGNLMSAQMGLGFAMAYDPQNASQAPVISEFLSMISLLAFLAMNGHLMVIDVLVQSFSAIPIGVFPHKTSWLNIANTGGIIFASGLLLALPIVAAMMLLNTALAVLGRVSAQLNLMAVGFPIMILIGLTLLYVGMSYLGTPFRALYETGLRAMLGIFVFK